jgi:hypothetical protein
MENWEDDRPIRLPNRLNIKNLNELAGKIVEKYPVPKQPFIHAGPKKVESPFSDRCPNSFKVSRAVCNCTSCKGIRRIEKKVNLGRVGEPWDNYEETMLKVEVKDNRPVAEIAKLHKRTNGAIRSRMELLNIEFEPEIKHEENKVTYDDAVDGECYDTDRLCLCSACRARWNSNII